MADDYEIAMLGRKMADMQKEIDALKRGSRSSQLANSSVHNGFIPFFDEDGVERFRVGRMPDGSMTSGSVNSPVSPNVPKTPVVIAGLGTLSVGVEGLTGIVPYDFSHCRVYVDGLLDGTITRLPGIWIAGPLDTSSHSIQVTAVNQSGKESAKTAPVYATPQGVVQRNFTTNPITKTEIADLSITTPMLTAAVVQANNVAANAILAAAIKAGAVTAEKLEAVMVIANRIVLGDPAGRNVSIDPSGIYQVDEFGQTLLQFGSNPAGGNFLTITDPNDTQSAVASLDAEGVFTCSGFSVNGGATLNGESLADMIDVLPRGLVGWANNSTDTATTTSILGIMELEVQTETNRHYRICTNTGYLGPGGIPANAQAETRIQFTTDGSRPTINSPVMEISARATGFGEPMRIECTFDGARCPSRRLRILYTVAALTGTAVQMITPAGNSLANDLQLWVEDIGPRRGQTGIASNGGGSSAPPVADYTREYTTTWSASYNSASSSELYQGDSGYGPGRSIIGFNDSAIRSDLAGASISSVEVYLYATHWWYNSGGTVILGTHNRTGTGRVGASSGSWPGANGEVTRWNLGKPEGRWVSVPVSIGNGLRDNSIKGLALPYGGTDKQFYGKFQNNTCKLRIKYRK